MNTVRRPTRRLLALPATMLMLSVGLTACGDEDSEPGNGLDAVTVAGDFGKAPKVTWNESLQATALESEVLEKGDGASLEEGQSALVHIWIGNGYTEDVAYSSYDAKTPESLKIDKELFKALRTATLGQTVGSRVLVTSPPKDAYGDNGQPDLGIGNADSLVFVVDVMGEMLSAPEGKERKAPGWVPTIVEQDGLPSGFTFPANAKPGDDLRVATLIEGEGDTVAKGDTIHVNYLGQTQRGEKPFDESYSAGQPTPIPLEFPGVIKGWFKGLQGVKVGSRVVMEVPPAFGYGAQGNPDAKIEGTDTLYFVIDVLASN